MRNRAVITNVSPMLEGGKYYIKRVTGEDVKVRADIFCDGDEVLKAAVLYRREKSKKWQEVIMKPLENEAWEGEFIVTEEGFYEYKIEAWVDHLTTWYYKFRKKVNAGRSLDDDLMLGSHWLSKAAAQAVPPEAALLKNWAALLDNKARQDDAIDAVMSDEFEEVLAKTSLRQHTTVYDRQLRILVGRHRELFSTWYLMFPRSASEIPGRHGTFKDCVRLLPRIAGMGFDVLFLPPIFPIGETNRKGKNNAFVADNDDVGSPWSIGSKAGGHKMVNPQLGTMQDFEKLVTAAAGHGMELALDISLRCAADHPYITEHPDWFHRLPDGRLVLDEIPPLNYHDIVDFNFECDDWENLWKELKSLYLFWAEKGVRIFYASTPHWKPFSFWQWVIREVQAVYPDAIFISGAFTRPIVNEELAKAGFNQSFTYFLWHNSNKFDLQQYVTELAKGETKEYLHPNFFTNTPDILPANLANQGDSAFMLQYALAAMLGSNCGIYGPVFELMYNQRFPDSKERYLHSEKYEITNYDWGKQNRLTDFITRLNQIRREHPALQNFFNVSFTNTDNEKLLSFVKATPDRKSIIWCVVNMDPNRNHSGYIEVPKEMLGLKGKWFNLEIRELLTGETYHWFNDWNFVELKPDRYPLHVLKLEVPG